MDTIEQFAKDYGAAYESGNVDRILSLMTDDFVALTPDKPVLVGKETVARELESDLGSMDVQKLEFKHEEVVETGQWAYAWGRSEAVVKLGGEDLTVDGKYLWILRKTPDGWKLARDSAHGD